MLAMESRMSALKIDPELLRELLNAASRTALTHRGSESEAYVLGQLEATANFAYVWTPSPTYLLLSLHHWRVNTLLKLPAKPRFRRLDLVKS